MPAPMQDLHPVPHVPQRWCVVAKQCKHALELLQFYGAGALKVPQTPELGNSRPD